MPLPLFLENSGGLEVKGILGLGDGCFGSGPVCTVFSSMVFSLMPWRFAAFSAFEARNGGKKSEKKNPQHLSFRAQIIYVIKYFQSIPADEMLLRIVSANKCFTSRGIFEKVAHPCLDTVLERSLTLHTLHWPK